MSKSSASVEIQGVRWDLTVDFGTIEHQEDPGSIYPSHPGYTSYAAALTTDGATLVGANWLSTEGNGQLITYCSDENPPGLDEACKALTRLIAGSK